MTEPESRPESPPLDHQAEIRRRQRSRALITAVLLGGFVILVYAISIAKMTH